MKIKDMIVLVPVSFLTTALKFARFDLNDEDKKYIGENHLYHCTASKEVAENIIKSGYLRPATGALKTINSYGHASVCLFGGIPNTDNFMKNLNMNLYTEPDRITNAVEICIHEDELNNNYKSRKISDEAILYEGYCILPQDRAKVVQLVMDLKRDKEGNPLLDEKGNPVGLEMRKRTLDEIRENPDEYIPKRDYLEYVMEKQKEYGMSTKENSLHKAITEVSFLGRVGNMEGKEIIRSTKKNIKDILRDWKDNIRRNFDTKRVDENPDLKIERLSKGKAYLERKNPYDDPKFALAVTRFGYEGIKQRSLEEGLNEFTNSEAGKFLRDKYNQIDKEAIKKNGIHGIEHTDRVALLATMIAENEKILDGEDSDRKKEILSFSAYYHDIGRVLNVGPHAKRGADLAKKIEMRTLDGDLLSDTDKRIVRMIIEGHEGKDEKIDKLLKKYQIPEGDKDMAKQLLAVIKDADALDRARLTTKSAFSTKTNLDPKYLRYRSSKELMEFSYGLEYISSNIKNFEDILNYKNREPNAHYQTAESRKRENAFRNWLIKGAKSSEVQQSIDNDNTIDRDNEKNNEGQEYGD